MGGIVVTAPVADRAWALDTWFDHLAEQTRPPDEIILLHSGRKGDDTWHAIGECADEYQIRTHRLHDDSIPHQRHDNARFVTLARLRNQLLGAARMFTDCEFLFSLDTDIMLENWSTIEELLIPAARYGVASPLVYLHPDMRWTVNAGMLDRPQLLDGSTYTPPGHQLEKWVWQRAEPTAAALAGDAVQPIDIPMAAILMHSKVFTTARYARHESGEDIAFGISLKKLGHRAVWLPSIEARHVWDESRLEVQEDDEP